MKLKEHLPFCVFALVVLACFYAIYFIKQIAQKRRGIQTRQIGKRKEKTLHTVEVLMGIATLVIVPVQILLSVCSAISYFLFPCFVCATAGARVSPKRTKPNL